MQNANMTKKADRIEIIDRKDITGNSNRSKASPERKRKVMASRATGRKTRLDGRLDQPDRRVGDIPFSCFGFGVISRPEEAVRSCDKGPI
jgi:hypothetical protein